VLFLHVLLDYVVVQLQLSVCWRRAARNHVICRSFPRCRNVYPIRITRPRKTVKVPLDRIYGEVVAELNGLGIKVDTITADAPKRADLRNTLRFNGRMGCDYCLCVTVRHERKLVYTANACFNRRIRDHGDMDRITQGMSSHVEDRDSLPQGLVGRSPLMDLDGFDVIRDLTLDHMHLFDRGVTMRVIEMGFNVATKRRSNAPRLTLSPLNEILLATLLPHEMTRRTRVFDFKNWKGKLMAEFWF
jgi:hypothetical protein